MRKVTEGEEVNILVTGGAGFLGSQLVKRLLPIVGRLFVVDDLSTGNKEQLPSSEKITFFKGSFDEEEYLDEVLPQVEILYHLACRNLVQSIEDPEEDIRVNLWGGFRLLEKVREKGKRLKRFVYTSTASVYGEADLLPTPEQVMKPNFPYAASKLAMEHYCQVYHRLYRVPVVTLRLSNVYGPGQVPTNPYCGVVSKFLEALERREPLTIYGDGEQTRDFTYVEDVMDLLLTAGWDERLIGGIWNVATGVETTVNRLAEQVKEAAGLPDHPLRYLPKREVDQVRRRCLDISRLKKEIGWEPRHSLKEGLRKTYAWWREERNR